MKKKIQVTHNPAIVVSGNPGRPGDIPLWLTGLLGSSPGHERAEMANLQTLIRQAVHSSPVYDPGRKLCMKDRQVHMSCVLYASTPICV